MGLAEDLAPDAAKPPPTLCAVAWLLEVAGDDAGTYRAALADRRVTGGQIVEAARKHHGVDVGRNAVDRHRRGECAC